MRRSTIISAPRPSTPMMMCGTLLAQAALSDLSFGWSPLTFWRRHSRMQASLESSAQPFGGVLAALAALVLLPGVAAAQPSTPS